MTVKKNKSANAYRGEVALELGGTAYVLVPSYENLAAVEEACEMGLIKIVRKLGEGDLRVPELAQVVSALADPPIGVKEAGSAIAASGVHNVIELIGQFLVAALLGGDEGNVEAAAGK